MEKKVYLVFGGESCGNHLATDLLQAAGITRATSALDIPGLIPEKLRENQFPVVYRRSFPHGGTWYNLRTMLGPIFRNGLIVDKDILVIIPIRNWHCAIKSQLKRGHTKDREQAIEHLQKAYRNILEQVKELDYVFFPFDTIVSNPENVRYFYELIGMKVDDEKLREISSKIREENQKWYGDKPFTGQLAGVETKGL
ncbi:MAG: hypothetical protein GY861_17645 [bacterium]|nr:hypothetical protein [bacterium]